MRYTLSLAQREDLPEIVAIYNSTIASRQVTADLQPVSVAECEAWFVAHQRENRPLYVVRDVSGCLMAWASLSDYYPRAAYHRTAEVSIYIHPQHRGAGLGKWLLGEIIRARLHWACINWLRWFLPTMSAVSRCSVAWALRFGGGCPRCAIWMGCWRMLCCWGKRFE